MKKYIKIAALPMLAAGLLTTSCELTEENPSAGDTSLKSFVTWKGLQSYSYSTLANQLYSASDWLVVSEAGTDLWMAAANGDGYQQVFNYESFTPSYNSTMKLWQQCNSMITNCNTVINQAGDLMDGDPDEIKVLVAESKVLRAFYNYLLVTNFGPVTLNLNSSAALSGDIALRPTRNSEKEFYDQIEKDLKEAIPDLGITPYENNKSRVTKKTAIAILAKAYAQRAGLGQSKFGDAEKYWKLAAETAEDLINNAGAYGAYLYPDIADMWAEANNRDNKEALFIAAGTDANAEVGANEFVIASNKLSAYTSGGSYDEFFNKNHRPGDKGYFYGRLNQQIWQPSEYLMYCFNPKWDRRWEYSFGYAWNEWSMVSCGWVPRSGGQKTITEDMCSKYGIDPSQIGKTLYPYADCDGIASAYQGNQFPAYIWPKGYTGDDKSALLTVAPSSAQIDQPGYSGSTKAYAIPYPIAPDDDRFNTVYVHEPMSAADKARCPYVVVVISDLYGSNGLPYGNTARGSEAGNPPAIGNGLTNAKSAPSLIKFNWTFNGAWRAKDLQCRLNDMYIMRMAEVYLIAAEARQMLGDGPAAANHLNVLRKRAARKGAAESEWRLSTATEDDIFDEYARELCGEFNRWALLKRHNAFESRLAKYNKRAAQSFKPQYYNRPVSNDFLETILNAEQYGDNGYGQTANSGLQGFEN